MKQFLTYSLFLFSAFALVAGLNAGRKVGKHAEVSPKAALTKIEAERFDYNEGQIAIVSCTNGTVCGFYVTLLSDGDVLGYYDVDFKDGATGFHISVAADPALREKTGRFYLLLDDPNGTLIGTVIIGSTDGNENWVTVTQFFEYPPVGVHDLFFKFSSHYTEDYIGNIDWFQFFN